MPLPALADIIGSFTIFVLGIALGLGGSFLFSGIFRIVLLIAIIGVFIIGTGLLLPSFNSMVLTIYTFLHGYGIV